MPLPTFAGHDFCLEVARFFIQIFLLIARKWTNMQEYRGCARQFFLSARFLADFCPTCRTLLRNLHASYVRFLPDLTRFLPDNFLKNLKNYFSPFFIFFTFSPLFISPFLTLFYLARKLPDFYRICPRIRTLDLSFLHRTLYR